MRHTRPFDVNGIPPSIRPPQDGLGEIIVIRRWLVVVVVVVVVVVFRINHPIDAVDSPPGNHGIKRTDRRLDVPSPFPQKLQRRVGRLGLEMSRLTMITMMMGVLVKGLQFVLLGSRQIRPWFVVAGEDALYVFGLPGMVLGIQRGRAPVVGNAVGVVVVVVVVVVVTQAALYRRDSRTATSKQGLIQKFGRGRHHGGRKIERK
eukprot:scaffold1221_cov207-Amphora_coffeaeformis.AAC.55